MNFGQRVCHLKKDGTLFAVYILQNFTTMNSIINKFKKINKELRYGVIYVVTSLNSSLGRVRDSDGNIVSDGLLSQLQEGLIRLTNFDVEVVEVPGAEEAKLVARRINVGNAGHDAVVEMPLSYSSFRDILTFVESATDVLSTDEGDKVLEQEYDSDFFMISEDLSEQFAPKKSDSLSSIDRLDKKYLPSVQPSSSAPVARADVEIEEEEKELLTIEQQQEVALKAIQAQILDYVTKYQADPSQLLHTLLDGKIVIGSDNKLSPLVVNKDLKIVLSYYNEIEVKMPAMCRAIYIMFLKHHEGIALRDFADYRADLEDIYSMVMPGRNEERAKVAIDNLLDPMSNTLNEYISKIKRCFKSCIINDELASNYIITGKRGEPYRVALAPKLITLPRAVTG